MKVSPTGPHTRADRPHRLADRRAGLAASRPPSRAWLQPRVEYITLPSTEPPPNAPTRQSTAHRARRRDARDNPPSRQCTKPTRKSTDAKVHRAGMAVRHVDLTDRQATVSGDPPARGYVTRHARCVPAWCVPAWYVTARWFVWRDYRGVQWRDCGEMWRIGDEFPVTRTTRRSEFQSRRHGGTGRSSSHVGWAERITDFRNTKHGIIFNECD